MKPVFKALVALAVLCPVTDYVVSEQRAAERQAPHEDHSYTRQDTAALDGLIGRPDDLLAFGRRNATRKAGRHYTAREAALLTARLWNIRVKP